ncbi:MAG: toll/interleukin-1 receptor domain-containing protein [Deltaproteobacteria bacterium]|nr:toll/interleukin-1 receptor domain-containing protein [Deltaproteobacteria bacterium]MBF0524849.1 toll/interleukin-1 receptor domain-containing protein [Deltaproteobacteria bacterium]
MTTIEQGSGIFDFFISYKRKDTNSFAERLASSLSAFEAEVWLDKQQMHAGDSILSGIEEGIARSIDAVIILSRNYFEGWSEHERRTLYSLMISKKMRIIPIWYQLTIDDVASLAPMFTDMVAIEVAEDSDDAAINTGKEILKGYKVSQREERLYEMFFRAVRRHVKDPDLDVFLAIFENNNALLKEALEAGANPNVTTGQLWNRYNKIIMDHENVWPAWRKLFLHLSERGLIGSQ